MKNKPQLVRREELERHVLELAQSGQCNQETADTLFRLIAEGSITSLAELNTLL